MLLGCFAPDSGAAKAKSGAASSKGGTVSVAIDWVNYNHVNTFDFSVVNLMDPQQPEIGGGGVNVLDSGGSKSCCIKIPKVWHPGLKVQVNWNEADRKVILGEWKKELEIPPYKEPGDLYVVFNTDHTVELVVSPAEPGSPKWAGKIKETPMAKCYTEIGRKECRRWIYDPASARHQNCLKISDVESCQDILKFCREHPEDDHNCVQKYDD